MGSQNVFDKSLEMGVNINEQSVAQECGMKSVKEDLHEMDRREAS